jgi:hypothetical protein
MVTIRPPPGELVTSGQPRAPAAERKGDPTGRHGVTEETPGQQPRFANDQTVATISKMISGTGMALAQCPQDRESQFVHHYFPRLVLQDPAS